MSLLSRSTSSAALALTFVAIAVVAIVLAATGQTSSAGTSGRFQIEDTQYEFAPTACTATDSDFVAAGSGTIDGERFWVSATSRSMTLTVGTSSEIARPAEDNVWLTSLGEVHWSASEGQIEVVATMIDSRNVNPARSRASLTIVCPPST